MKYAPSAQTAKSAAPVRLFVIPIQARALAKKYAPNAQTAKSVAPVSSPVTRYHA